MSILWIIIVSVFCAVCFYVLYRMCVGYREISSLAIGRPANQLAMLTEPVIVPVYGDTSPTKVVSSGEYLHDMQ